MPAKKKSKRKPACRKPGRGSARTIGEALDALETDFSRSKKPGPMAALGHARKLRRGPVQSKDSAMEELRAGEGLESHVPRNNAKAIQAVLAARSKAPAVFHSDSDAIMWMLAPHDDLGGKAPLDAIFGGDWSKAKGPVATPVAPINSPLTDDEIMFASMAREITAADLSRYPSRALRAVGGGNIFVVSSKSAPRAMLLGCYPLAKEIIAVSKAHEAGLVQRVQLKELRPVRSQNRPALVRNPASRQRRGK